MMNLEHLMSEVRLLVKRFGGTDGCEDVSKYIEASERKMFFSIESVDTCQFIMDMVIWAKYGYSVFDVDDDLLAGLLLTSPSDAPVFPHLPLPSFVIRLSPGFVPYPRLATGAQEQSWLVAIHVSYLRNVPDDVNSSGANLLRISMMNDPEMRDGLTFTSVVNEAKFVSAQHLLKQDASFLWEDSTVSDPEYKRLEDMVVRIVFNLCSWLESVGGLSSRKQANLREYQEAKKRQLPRSKRWVLCSEIPISAEIVEAAKQSGQGSSRGWHVTRRYVVRGHLRNQVCGVGRQDRRVIWVAPYWKGPEGGDVLNHLYRASEKLRKSKRDGRI